MTFTVYNDSDGNGVKQPPSPEKKTPGRCIERVPNWSGIALFIKAPTLTLPQRGRGQEELLSPEGEGTTV